MWLAALRGLDFDHAPDLPPHISLISLPADEIRLKVVKAMRGPMNWTTPGSIGPKPTRQLFVRFTANRTSVDNSYECAARLIPGKDLVILISGRKLEVRRLQPMEAATKGRARNLVWRDQDPAYAKHRTCGYDFELENDGASLVIALSMENPKQRTEARIPVCVSGL